jgi:hypothetical protein
MVSLESIVFEQNPFYDNGKLDVYISSSDENVDNQYFEVSKENFLLDSDSFWVDYWTYFGDTVYETDENYSRDDVMY